MNTRGLMELIVLNIGLDLGVISIEIFTMMVLMALVTTVMTTPILSWLLPMRPTHSTAALGGVDAVDDGIEHHARDGGIFRSEISKEIRTLTRDPRFLDVPVIMCTSKNQETDKVWGMRQGARDYITKPVDVSELMAKIKALG